MKQKDFSAFVAGVIFGVFGIKALSTKEAKKVYATTTAAALRGKESVMVSVSQVREFADDVYADAKLINQNRSNKTSTVIENTANN